MSNGGKKNKKRKKPMKLSFAQHIFTAKFGHPLGLKKYKNPITRWNTSCTAYGTIYQLYIYQIYIPTLVLSPLNLHVFALCAPMYIMTRITVYRALYGQHNKVAINTRREWFHSPPPTTINFRTNPSNQRKTNVRLLRSSVNSTLRIVVL